MDVLSVGGNSWLDFAIFQILDSLFTGLMLVAVIAFTVRFLKVRGVTFKVDVDNRDQDGGD